MEEGFATKKTPLFRGIKYNYQKKHRIEHFELIHIVLWDMVNIGDYIPYCRNLPFGGRARRDAKGASSHEENVWSRHQRLFEENIRKTKKRSANFENKGSRVIYARGRY